MSQTKKQTQTLVLGAILTALVVVLQLAGSFIRFSMFSISLVLVPIVIGASKCGVKIGAWLGFVFGAAVLLSGDAAAFLAISVPGTVITVLLKGVACGVAAGAAYKLLENKNRYLAVMFAAVVCPIANTGVFLLSCKVFFMETITQWAAANNFANATAYMFLGLAGINFIVELATNVVLAPGILRILNIKEK